LEILKSLLLFFRFLTLLIFLSSLIEFAKEAMHCQALDQSEVLSIRWAHDDPNPVAKDSIERADKDAMVGLLQAKGVSLTPAGFNYPADYQMPAPKRLRVEEGGTSLEQYPELAYPNTDEQYQQYISQYYGVQIPNQATTTAAATTTSSSSSSAVDTATAQREALLRLGILAPSEVVEKKEEKETEEKKETEGNSAEESKEKEGEEEEEAAEEEEGGWQKFVDENTGATYYFNTSTGESSWTDPEEKEEK
jgi:hypothetical protein